MQDDAEPPLIRQIRLDPDSGLTKNRGELVIHIITLLLYTLRMGMTSKTVLAGHSDVLLGCREGGMNRGNMNAGLAPQTGVHPSRPSTK